MAIGWINLCDHNNWTASLTLVVSQPSGLKSCSLWLELFQFPIRGYLNIWRFWSFWFICRKYRKIFLITLTEIGLGKLDLHYAVTNQSKHELVSASLERQQNQSSLGFVMFFPRLATVGSFFFAFWLVHYVIWVRCDWPDGVYDSQDSSRSKGTVMKRWWLPWRIHD